MGGKLTNKKIKEKRLPKIGEYYHFFDDGKCSMSRHYICRIERIITPEESKSIKVKVPRWNWDKNENDFEIVTLWDRYHEQIKEHNWVYMPTTDYLIEVSCPTYDDNNLWFIRQKGGGWFSIDVQNCWQGGELDITGEIFENIVNNIIEDGGDPSGYYETTYEKH